MISENDFENYVAIQFSGFYNMITDCEEVMKLLGWTFKKYFEVQVCYSKLVERYPNAYEQGRKIGEVLRNENCVRL